MKCLLKTLGLAVFVPFLLVNLIVLVLCILIDAVGDLTDCFQRRGADIQYEYILSLEKWYKNL